MGINIFFTDAAEGQVNILHNYTLSKYLKENNSITKMIRMDN